MLGKMALICGCMLITGCSANSFFHGMYEGMRIENQRGSAPGERLGKPEMDYRQYEQARKERIEQGREMPGK